MMKTRASILAVMLTACGSAELPAPAPRPNVAPSAAATPAPPATAPAPAPSFVARGKLLGHDGKPMKLAHVHAGGQTIEAGEGGGFRFEAPGPGFHAVRFTGVDHEDLTLDLYFDGAPVDVEVTLGTYARLDPPFRDAVVVVYAPGEGGALPAPVARVPVKRLPDGRYGATITRKLPEVLYALDDVARDHRVNGAGASFVYDGRKTYLARLPLAKGRAQVVIDAAAMPPAGARPLLAFGDEAARGARITRLCFLAAAQREGAGEPSWYDAVVRATATEADPEVLALLNILAFAPPGGRFEGDPAALARGLFDRVPATSPLWACAPEAAIVAADRAGRTPARAAYLDALGEGLGDRDKAADFTAARLRAATIAGRADEAAAAFATMRARFAGTPQAQAVAFYDPARRVRPGSPAPGFDLPLLAGGPLRGRITPASLRGKVVLFDFWGVWCAPCLAEMRNLHEVFARHRAAGFTIVSVAVRSNPGVVRTYRAGRWPMPWNHVVLDEKNQEETIDLFEIKSYPSPILVGADGKILAAGDELRGEGIERAVAAALGE